MTIVIENRPSKKQRELLSYIDVFIKEHGYGPSYREIMHALDLKSVSTVAIHVNNLIKKGHLRKGDNSARSLEVVRDEAVFHPKVAITRSEEKWLIDTVMTKFSAAETATLSQKLLDELYVLVGALHVLGLHDAATALKPKLTALKRQID